MTDALRAFLADEQAKGYPMVLIDEVLAVMSKSPPVPRTNTDPTDRQILAQLTGPIGMIRHSLTCTMRKAIYDGARCDCDLEGQIAKAVQREAAPLLADLAAARVELAAVTEQRDKLRKHSQTHRGELSGYTVGEVEFVESRLRAAEAQLAAVTTAMTEYRAHLLDEIQNGHGANREAYQRVLDWLAALMEGTTE